MILLAHPFGNANVRAVLEAAQRRNLLAKYVTTLGWSNECILSAFSARRGYDLPRGKIESHPAREMVRLLAASLGVRSLIAHERGWASIDRVWRKLDRAASDYLCANKQHDRITTAYAYEDCALHIFEAANDLHVRRVYDLPIAYWQTAQQLLTEEARRYPDWEPTLGATRDSAEKLARKTRELELAELVICPSNFVHESLPEKIRATKQTAVIPFGSPAILPNERKSSGKLRVLFAGALTQRKGLADLFAAMKLIDSERVELVVMGSLLQPLDWYRERYPHFIYEAPRAHAGVLRLMRTCDVLVLPSIVEGRALVQQEAMACSLPLIVTRNAGVDDLIDEGETGFLVPIRSPEAIAAKIDWCAAHRESISGMGIAAQKRTATLTWRSYGDEVVAAIENLTGE
ncbi:MAG: glycosyltransferase family 4 protein [Chthoniobacterales bacterium]